MSNNNLRLCKFYRLLRGLSQQELADLVNIAQPQISKLEKQGEISVSSHTLDLIAKVLKFPFEAHKLVNFVNLESNESKSA